MGTYEEFEPATQVKKDDPENTILLLHLPGFVKEQVKITYVQSSRSIKVEGQRRAVEGDEGNKWVGFNKVFQVPPNNCKGKIHARFQNGILTLTMPNNPPPSTTNIKSETGGGPPPKQEHHHVVKEEEKAADHLLNNNKIGGGVLKKPAAAEKLLGSLKQQQEQEQEQLNNGSSSDHDQQEPAAPKTNRSDPLGRRPLNYYLQSNETSSSSSSSLLLNVGVALLVVVALGAFATYKIRSKSKHY